MNKIYLPYFLGNTFQSQQEYKDGELTIPIGTMFRLIAREGGKYLYRYEYLMFVCITKASQFLRLAFFYNQ
jgi:hypothetical protein